MAAENDVIMENNATSTQFRFRAVNVLKPKKSQPPISIPIINAGPENNVLFRFVGQSEEVTFTFALFDDGVDVANGTHTITVKTVSEQIIYLKDTFFSKGYATDWNLWTPNGQVYPTASQITGVISAVDFDLVQGPSTVVTGTLTFQRGRIGSL